MNNLMIFEGKEVEVFEFEGKVLFNPRHVGSCLELNGKAIQRQLDRMNKNQIIKLTNSATTNSGIRKLNNAGERFITESGVYKMIFASRSEGAERFQDWVTDEVLPQIRQTGGYIPIEQDMSDNEIMARALMIAQNTIDKKEKLINEMKPKVDIHDRFIDKGTTFGFREIRKELESTLEITIKENELKEVMRDKKWIGKTLKGLANAVRDGYVATKDILDKNGNPHTQDRFTMKAREELLGYYKQNI